MIPKKCQKFFKKNRPWNSESRSIFTLSFDYTYSIAWWKLLAFPQSQIWQILLWAKSRSFTKLTRWIFIPPKKLQNFAKVQKNPKVSKIKQKTRKMQKKMFQWYVPFMKVTPLLLFFLWASNTGENTVKYEIFETCAKFSYSNVF